MHQHDTGTTTTTGNDETADPETAAVAGRRRALAAIGGAGLAGIAALAAACSPGTDPVSGGTDLTTTTAGASSTTAVVATSCSAIPEETAGPYPGDGSNGKQVLTQDGVVRSDIRSSFGSSTTTVDGIPLTVHLDVSDTANGCDPLQGAAVYLWHADPQGRYSMYSNGVTEEDYLRGVQVTDADGRVTFTTVVPGCYDGRWPHVHFEVYPDVASITNARNAITTSQLAFPKAMVTTAYASSSLYPTSTSNLSRVSLEDDNVFGDDDGVHQVATVTGDATSGYTATLAVPV
jgi:protocatechuate 3,4-dioxygenase beta subunit